MSIVAKNVEVMAMRHAHEGDWAAAIATFDSDRQVNGLGLDTRGDRIDDLSALLRAAASTRSPGTGSGSSPMDGRRDGPPPIPRSSSSKPS